jgi:uncharacterized protein YndB with AHSA1/START domain
MFDRPISDRIEKSIEIAAPVARVWQALTDYREFSQWFRVMLARPFEVGKTNGGRLTHPEYNHMWEATVQKMEPERYFSLTWHPFAHEKARDYSNEPQTLVEFTLEKTAAGTLLRVVETGFDRIPADRRAEAFRAHNNGWDAQLGNIARYVEHAPKRAMAS